MFIDIHAHAVRIPAAPFLGFQTFPTPEQLLNRYRELNVDRGILLPLVSPEVYLPQANEDILEMAERFPGKFIPFCNIDPRVVSNSFDAPLDRCLKYYKDKGCRGVGEVTVNLPFLHPLVQNLFKHTQEAGLPLTFHIAPQMGGCYGIHDDPGLPQLEQCLGKFSKLKFLAHSATFWAEISRLETPADRRGYPSYPVNEEGVVPKLFRRYPNLLGDLSAGSGCNALTRDPDYAAHFLAEFQDRLFFGIDICKPDGPAPLAGFLVKLRDEKKISQDVFSKVTRENAVKLLGL
ncbi:MAG: amidohydrolase family protein [Verrucomicrobiae bacterium]|nr:amidohydrolase family protein [Verrucomicrobiae bacterium]